VNSFGVIEIARAENSVRGGAGAQPQVPVVVGTERSAPEASAGGGGVQGPAAGQDGMWANVDRRRESAIVRSLAPARKARRVN